MGGPRFANLALETAMQRLETLAARWTPEAREIRLDRAIRDACVCLDCCEREAAGAPPNA